MSPLRVAVVGAGHLGSRHAEKYSRHTDRQLADASLAGAALVAVCDSDVARASDIAAKSSLPGRPPVAAVGDYRELVGKVDAVSIATPTASHAEIAQYFLERGVHALVEKPITRTVEEAASLVALARARGLVLAVGHVERFNPAIRALADLRVRPRYVESYRISPFRFRSMDIGVVHDLMIHDLDLILQLIDQPVERVEAHGVGVFGPREDIANARLTFADGSVATATASRVSLKSERKIRLFADELYASLDLDSKEARVIRKGEALRSGRIDPTQIDPRSLENPMAFVLGQLIDVQQLAVVPGDALEAELDDFLGAVRHRRDPAVTGEHGLRALAVAEQVVARVSGSLDRARGSG